MVTTKTMMMMKKMTMTTMITRGLLRRQKRNRLKQKKTTVIVITHRSGVLAQLDKLLIMRDGQMIAFGPREEVMEATIKKVEAQKAKTAGLTPITVPPII